MIKPLAVLLCTKRSQPHRIMSQTAKRSSASSSNSSGRGRLLLAALNLAQTDCFRAFRSSSFSFSFSIPLCSALIRSRASDGPTTTSQR